MTTKFTSYLYRKTTSTAFVPEVDGFRFFAIFTVLLYHMNTHVSRVIASMVESSYYNDSATHGMMKEGGIGVNVFFAISGFILALPFARQHLFNTQPVNLKSYFIRRLTRLEPPYVLSLILFLGVHLVILHENFNAIFPNFLASLFYVHNIVYDQWSVINPVAWSLEVEVQFYVLAPLLAFVFAIANTLWRRAVIIFIMIAGMLHYNFNYEWIEYWHLRKSLFMHLHQFFVGFLMADIYLVSWKSSAQKKNFLWDIIGISAMASLLIWNDPFQVKDDIIFGVSLLLTFIAVFKGTLVNRFYTNPVIVIIGGMCYTIYLLHYAAIAFLSERSVKLFQPGWSYGANFLLQVTVVIPIVLLVSAIFFVLIERPCMDKDWPAKAKAKILSVFSRA